MEEALQHGVQLKGLEAPNVFNMEFSGWIFSKLERNHDMYISVGSTPNQDSSHHQGYDMFSRESLENICNCYWAGGRSNISEYIYLHLP